MSFGKVMLAVICGELILGVINVAVQRADYHFKERAEQHRRRAGFEFEESLYSGRKNNAPHARQIGFGANE